MNRGYMGKILMVDLATGFREETIPDEVYEKYLSGLGLAAYLLYDRIPAGADPLGPDNILGFVSGLLTGTGSLFCRQVDGGGKVSAHRRLGRCQLRRLLLSCHQALRL